MPTKYSRTKIVTDTSSLISLQTGDILELMKNRRNGCKQEQQQAPLPAIALKARYQKHEKLEKEIKAEFPGDEMMFKLHFLRALKYLAGKMESK